MIGYLINLGLVTMSMKKATLNRLHKHLNYLIRAIIIQLI